MRVVVGGGVQMLCVKTGRQYSSIAPLQLVQGLIGLDIGIRNCFYFQFILSSALI